MCQWILGFCGLLPTELIASVTQGLYKPGVSMSHLARQPIRDGGIGIEKGGIMVDRFKVMSLALTMWCAVAAVGTRPSLGAFVATVDGDLSDWGIAVSDNNLSVYAGLTNPSSGHAKLGGSDLFYQLEDQDDLAPITRFLGPNYGGQNYDAEFIGVVLSGSKMSIAIVTGQRPDNFLTNYSPGDLLIRTSTGIYGVEVGGAPPTPIGSTSAVVSSGDPGVTFNVIPNNGHTSGYRTSAGTTGGTPPSGSVNALQVAGSIWQDPVWLNDPIAPFEPAQQLAPTTLTPFGQADFRYTLNSVTQQHSIIELAFDANGMGSIYSVRWTPGCGNDVLQADFEAGGRLADRLVTPEPSATAVWGLGALCVMGWCHRRRLRRAQAGVSSSRGHLSAR